VFSLLHHEISPISGPQITVDGYHREHTELIIGDSGDEIRGHPVYGMVRYEAERQLDCPPDGTYWRSHTYI
jgi:hypothetical protein